MKETTINEIQMIKAWAVINCSEKLLQKYRELEYGVDNDEMKYCYKQLANVEESRLQMAYSLLRALGLSYDPDTYEITKREEVQ